MYSAKVLELSVSPKMTSNRTSSSGVKTPRTGSQYVGLFVTPVIVALEIDWVLETERVLWEELELADIVVVDIDEVVEIDVEVVVVVD